MLFRINKCVTIVIEFFNIVQSHFFEDFTLYLDIYSLPKVSCYTYLGILFRDNLSLQPVISNH